MVQWWLQWPQLPSPLCCAKHLTHFAYTIVFMPLNNHIRKALSIWLYRWRKQDRERWRTLFEQHTIVKFLIQIYLLLPMLCCHPYMPMYMCFCQSHICPNFHCICNKMETNTLTEIRDEVGHREWTRQETDPVGPHPTGSAARVMPGLHSPGGWVCWGMLMPDSSKGWRAR